MRFVDGVGRRFVQLPRSSGAPPSLHAATEFMGANTAIACSGYSMGWTAPINQKLQDELESPLDGAVSPKQEAWIGSLLTLGAIFSPFFSGFAAAKIGRKWGLLTSAVPMFIGWSLIAAANTVALIYAGRIFLGLALGMVFTVCPMYCAEIATDDSRGALGSYLQGFLTLGYLIIYVVGPFVTYRIVAYVGLTLSAIFTISFFFMPETPFYLLTKNDKESAAKSLSIIRGRSREAVQEELDKCAAHVSASMENTATLLDVFRGSNFKAFYISIALLFFQQFSGITAVSFYLTDIFSAAGSTLDPAIATIIVGIVQVVASFMTPFIVDRLGRRVLLFISSAGTAVALILLGTYFILADNGNPAADALGFVPVLSLILFIVAFAWGLGPLAWTIMSELLPIEVKAIATPIATAFNWSIAFLVARYFGAVAAAAGLGATFFVFGACCACAFVFTLLVLPETGGKSFAEIQDELVHRLPKNPKNLQM